MGQKRPTASALYGLSGGVRDWCFDGWDEHAYRGREGGITDPVNTALRAGSRVYRGGSWYFGADYCRVAYRNYDRPAGRGGILGLRLLRRSHS